jgi:AraC-like DNA-binding protein
MQSHDVGERIALGSLLMLIDGAEGCGFSRDELFAAAGLVRSDENDPAAQIPSRHMTALVRFALARTSNAAFGLDCAERSLDLRRQGFWGYALLSSSSLRERLEVHQRYQDLRGGGRFTFRVEHGRAVLEFPEVRFPSDVAEVVTDWFVARSVMQLHEHTKNPELRVDVELTYPERPHHARLRRLVRGDIRFARDMVRIIVPAEALDCSLPGDPQLRALAASQLDEQKARHGSAFEPDDVAERVTRALAACLSHDASMVRVAAELGMSVRTLQRQLGAQGVSFQALAEEARRTRALRLLSQDELSVECIATQLGYGDASNFRRAFRRWTGVSPSDYRSRRGEAAGAE